MKDEDGDEPKERSRPTTPKWWRPNYPPKTYYWEEIRRQRERGGYPWTLLDRDRDIDDNMSDNLYEPVNPPPLYGSGYNMRFAHDTASLDGRVIDIPPEIDIITSEGLDGLDQPDFHDMGFDGDREWYHSDEDHGHSAPKSGFVAGIRNKELPKSGETSSIRPLTSKSVIFAAETEKKMAEQEVPATPEQGTSLTKPSAMEQLKQKAGQVKQRISKISLPVRPKFNNWTGIKLSRKKRKKMDDPLQQEEQEQEVPEEIPSRKKEPRAKPGRKEPLVIPQEVIQASMTKMVEQPLTLTTNISGQGVYPVDIAKQSEEKRARELENVKLANEQGAAQIAIEKERAKILQEQEEALTAKNKEVAGIFKDQEAARIAKEKEEATIAKEQEAARIAKEKEVVRLEKEQQAAQAAIEKQVVKIGKEQEAAQIAIEKQAAKIAKEQEAAQIAIEKQAAKIAKEQEAAQIAIEKQAAKIAKEQEAAQIALEKQAAKIAKEQEAAKIAKERVLQTISKEQDPTLNLNDQDAATKKQEEELRKSIDEQHRRLKAEEKSAQEELQKQKEEEKLNKEKAIEESKKIKAEEKAAKDKIKEEQRKAKAEDKLLTDQRNAELKRARVIEELMLEIEQANISKEEADIIDPEEELERKLAAIVDEFEQDLGPQMEDSKDKSVSPTPKKPSAGEVIKRKLADIDFTKRFKRSRTPPPRPEPPKLRFSRRDNAGMETKTLATQYSREIEIRDAEIDIDRLQEPQIYITQPSVEAESETHSEWSPPGQLSSELDWQSETNEEERELSEKPKLGTKLKEIGQGIGQKMKVIGHDLKQFGGKVNVKYKETIQEIKDTQERKRNREAKQAEDEDEEKLPRRRFRFKRRGNNEQEIDVQRYQPVVVETVKKEKKRGVKQPPAHYENNDELPEEFLHREPMNDDSTKVQRSQVLGRGDRDWESPLDLTQSREVSEEPNFSGNVSSGRDSPPGSSLASSSAVHGRRQGVMEEIDSDEFFLRERGISEGEDEELINRLLVEELRQTFRPTMSNALNDFDLPTPPAKPSRSPRKPPRKSKGKNGKKSPNFQTFPPERPKRKQTPGYISSYLENERNEDRWNNEDEKNVVEKEIEIENFNESDEDEEDEGIRRVKNELRKIDQDMEDEGRYEPISDSPQRPQRAKRKKVKTPEPPQILYYNTIAGNEWLKDLEDQITAELDLTLVDDTPLPPKRERRKSEGKSETHSQLRGTSEIDDSELQFADDDEINENERPKPSHGEAPPLAQAESVGHMDDGEDSLDYMDEAGYSIVQKNKESPKTIPRKKNKSTNGTPSKRNSLKRRSQEGRTTGSGPIFFSLPRYTPRTFHIVPPTRPHRTYSALRPRRPPRHKSMSNQNLENKSMNSIQRNDSPTSPSRLEDTDRPNTAIGIMQGRPLPPPPRPTRSPAPLNDLDQVSIERMVGVRHYANFDDQSDLGYRPVVEELCVASNISMLGGRDEEDEAESLLANSEINVAIQTDPIPDEDYELNTLGSFEDEDGRIDKIRYSLPGASSDEQQPVSRVERPPHAAQSRSRSPVPAQVIFPTRLHLDELEVDFLRVNELTAHTLTMDQLHSPHLQVNSVSSSGPLLVQSIQSPRLTTDNVTTERVGSGGTDIPNISVPPPEFYQLAPPSPKTNEGSKEVDDEYEIQRTTSLETQETLTSEQEEDESCPTLVDSSCEIQEERHVERSVRASPPRISASVAVAPRDPESDDVIDLAIRLGRAVFRLTIRTLEAITDYIDMATSNDPECQEQQRAHMQALICLLLILVAGIFLMTRSGSTPTRWEFYLPPPAEP